MAVRSTLLSLALGTLLATGMLPATAANTAPTASRTTEAPRGPTDLKPGEFLWHPEISPSGPIVLVVSLD